MSFIEDLDEVLFEKSDRMGSFAIQMDHPGLMPNLKKRKTTKTDRSFLSNDGDAGKQYIKDQVKTDGGAKKGKKSKIHERLTKKMELLNGRH